MTSLMTRPVALALVTLTLLASITHDAAADEVTPVVAARRMRNVGIIFTVLGAAVATGAIAAGIGGRSCAHASGEECGVVSFAATVGLGVGAVSLLAPGIPLWIAGDVRARRAASSVRFAAAPLISAQGGGAQASVTVRF